MSLQVSTYKQSSYSASSKLVESGCRLSQLLAPQYMRIGVIELFLKRGETLVEPIEGWISITADAPGSYAIAEFSISPAVLATDEYRRVRIVVDAWTMDEWTPYYISLVSPSGGEFTCLLAGTPPAEWYDALTYTKNDVTTTLSGVGMAMELYDTVYESGSTESAPAVMSSAGTTERDQLGAAYRPWAMTGWTFDDVLLPVHPTECSITEYAKQNVASTIDAQKAIITEVGPNAPRRVTGHMIDLQLPLVGREVVKWLQRYQEFDVRFGVEIPLLSPEYPEVAYTDENTDDYLYRYFGTMGHWKEDASTVYVWVDGRVTETGFEIDYTTGSVVFLEAQPEGTVVQLLYTWRPQVKLTIEPNWRTIRGALLATPRVTLWEGVYDG